MKTDPAVSLPNSDGSATPIDGLKKEITPEYRCPHCTRTFQESAHFLRHVPKHHQPLVPASALYTPLSLTSSEPQDISDLEFCEVCVPYLSNVTD